MSPKLSRRCRLGSCGRLVPRADPPEWRAVAGARGRSPSGTRKLDMRRGLLTSAWTHRTPAGVLSLADRAAGLQLVQLSLDRAGVAVRLEASFALAGLGMEPVRLEQDLGAWRTEGTQYDVNLGLVACATEAWPAQLIEVAQAATQQAPEQRPRVQALDSRARHVAGSHCSGVARSKFRGRHE